MTKEISKLSRTMHARSTAGGSEETKIGSWQDSTKRPSLLCSATISAEEMRMQLNAAACPGRPKRLFRIQNQSTLRTE